METSRRHFLKLAIAGVAACAPDSPGAGPEAFGDVSAGSASALSVGSLKAISGVSAAVGRDARGLYAMSLTCTHQGCDMRDGIGSGGIDCRCHGSRFDANGNVLQGPARDPLAHFAVTVDAQGNITVHGGQEVSSDTRTAAPA